MRPAVVDLVLAQGTAAARVLAIVFAIGGACVPSNRATFGPVDREIQQRLGVEATWYAGADDRVPSAVAALLQRPLDRDAAVRIALVANRRLQAQYDQLGIAASAIASATVLAPTEVDLEFPVIGGGEIELDVTQDVLDLLQIPQRRSIANAELAAARARAVAATVELVAQVEIAYVDVVAAQQELELREAAFDAASASAEVAERMHAAGNAPDLTLVRERDSREQARIEVARAQVEIEQRRELMNEVLGLSGASTSWTVTNRLPELPPSPPMLDGLEREAVRASLELAAVQSEAAAAAGRVGVARVRAWLPSLGLGVAANRNHEDAWEVGPAISLGLPIFNQQQGARARANAELRRSRNEATATAVELRARARASRQRVLGTHAEARHLLTVVLPLRQRVLDETLKQYNAMNASTFELLSARRELVEGGRQYIDALRRFWRASADARALARGALARTTGDDPMQPSRGRTTESH